MLESHTQDVISRCEQRQAIVLMCIHETGSGVYQPYWQSIRQYIVGAELFTYREAAGAGPHGAEKILGQEVLGGCKESRAKRKVLCIKDAVTWRLWIMGKSTRYPYLLCTLVTGGALTLLEIVCMTHLCDYRYKMWT